MSVIKANSRLENESLNTVMQLEIGVGKISLGLLV